MSDKFSGQENITRKTQSVFASASATNLKRPFKIAIFGASGFSREAADIVLMDQIKELVFVDKEAMGKTYKGYQLLSEENVSTLNQQGFFFVIGLGDNSARKKIYNKFKDLKYPNVIHPSSSAGKFQLERIKSKQGNVITAGVRLTNNIEIGNFGIYNLNATIGHDCIIEDFVNIAPGANISGNVKLCECVYVGTNSAVLQGKSDKKKMILGEKSTIGAGALVSTDVNAHDTVVGVPAKSIKKR
ncbi:MAG: acetyltransferase [Desulfobacteraceae bacterium]|nr:acetyltransferase [Desulfobacteraceae bacterium]